MNTAAIDRALRGHPASRNKFLGVFASDQLPKSIPFRPCCLVVNTHPAAKPGEHWVAMYISADGTVDYFDSYGLRPTVRSIATFVSRCGQGTDYNRKRVQGYLSSVCGQYCIYFLILRCLNLSMTRIVKPFRDSFVSDSYVAAWVNKKFRLKTPTFEDSRVVNQLCTVFQI